MLNKRRVPFLFNPLDRKKTSQQVKSFLADTNKRMEGEYNFPKATRGLKMLHRF